VESFEFSQIKINKIKKDLEAYQKARAAGEMKFFPPTKGEDVIYYKDERNNGAKLMLKISKTGVADYIIRERTKPKGSPKRFRIADISQPLAAVTARAKEMQQNIMNRRDPYYSADAPKPEEQDLSPTFHALHDDRQKHHKMENSTRQEYDGIFDRYLTPWHDLKTSRLMRDEILRLHKQITDLNGPRVADQSIAYARTLINSAIRNPSPDYTKPGSNIVAETMTYHGAWNTVGGQAERTSEPFPDDAWADLWLAIHDLKNRVPKRKNKKRPTLAVTAHYYFTMLLLTGLRGGQVSTIEWRQVDLDRGTISWIEKQDAQKTKTGEKVFYLPLCNYLLSVLKEMRAREIDLYGKCEGYLFKSLGAGKKGHVDLNMRTQWKMIKDQVPAIAERKPHDFRATFVSIGQNIGVNETILQMLINHKTYKQEKVIQGYTKWKVEMIRQQADKIANHFLEHVGEKAKAPESAILPDYVMQLAQSYAMKVDTTPEKVLERWARMGSQLDRLETNDPDILLIKMS